MNRLSAPALDPTYLSGLFRELGRSAAERRFDVAPNPCVGAAVLAGTSVIGRGVHEYWGGPHAEVRAFEAAAKSGTPQSAWDTLVVTLEPCSSRGKTPPCVEAVLASGVKRVVVGGLDPDPRHRGAGLQLLREAGVEVELFDRAPSLQELAPFFLRWIDRDRLRRPRPWTIAKWAQTRSGQLVPPPEIGGGRWISGAGSLDEVHVLRGRVDAIVSSVSTVLADDPRFSVRPPGDPSRPPMRVILDSYLRTPPTGRLFAPPNPGEGSGALHILCQAGANAARHRALEEAGAILSGLHPSEEDNLSLRDVQEWLWDHDVRRVLLEAGPRLLARYMQAGFVDQLRIYTGNVNGGQGESMAGALAGLRLEGRLDREVGPDSVLEAFVRG